MAARTRPPFRADHVGSLLRPPQLLKAREDFKEGRIDAAERSTLLGSLPLNAPPP